MSTGKELLANARTHLGETYVFGARVPMSNATWRGPWDCAEFITYCVNRLTNKLYGYSPAEGESYTGYWATDVERRVVNPISIDKAASIPGAIFLRRPKIIAGQKIIGHIAFSDGSGGTVEARGAKYGVCLYKAGINNERGWDTGILIPEIDYQLPEIDYQLSSLSPTGNKTNLSANFDSNVELFLIPSKEIDKIGVINKLADFNYLDKSTKNFNDDVILAIYNFQLSEGLEPSGVLDEDTLTSLGF